MKPATVVRTRDRRVDSKLEGDEVRPPQLYVEPMDEGEVDGAIEAVCQALGAEPNAVIEPRLIKLPEQTFGELGFVFNPQELPALDDTGGLAGWLPPYRAEEALREALLTRLPDDWALETKRAGHIILYRD